MLDVILGEEVRDVAVVVTRYFGGTLLGTGGLVRAYSQAVQAGLAASTVITKIRGNKLNIFTDYSNLGKIQYILGERGISLLDSIYTEQVELKIVVSTTELEAVKAVLIEGTNGQAVLNEGISCWFANISGRPAILDEEVRENEIRD